jgi:hypothetical protein
MPLDPEWAVYDVYGLERSLWRSWKFRTFWRYAQLLASDWLVGLSN